MRTNPAYEDPHELTDPKHPDFTDDLLDRADEARDTL